MLKTDLDPLKLLIEYAALVEQLHDKQLITGEQRTNIETSLTLKINIEQAKINALL